MADKLFPTGITATTTPALADVALIAVGTASRKVTLDDIGELLAAEGDVYDAIVAAAAASIPLASHAAHSIVARSANSSGNAADLAIGTDEGVFNVAGVLTSQKVKLANIDAAVQSAAQGTESLRQIGTAAAQTVGTANAAGSGVTAAAIDHAHDHGSQTTTTHHAVATTSGAGFMSTTHVTRQNALVQSYDPLAAFPSYQTIQTISGVCHFILIGGSSVDPFALVTNSGAASGVATAGRVGVANINTSTSATAAPCIVAAIVSFVFGSGVCRFRCDIILATASDGTETYTTRYGFNDGGSTTPGDGVDGAFFRYTHSVNGGRWECVTRSNSVETATDSGVAGISASYQCLEIEVNAAGTSVNFRINGASVATNTTNIPTGASRATGINMHIVKSAGTTARGFDIDLAAFHCELTSAI